MHKVTSSNKIVIDTLRNLMIINGEASLLSKNECLLIRYFYEKQGIAIPKDELMQQCWPGRVVSPASLPVAIKHIRDILKKSGNYDAIKTHKGEGYSLLPDTLEIDFIDAPTENKLNFFEKTLKNKRYLLLSRPTSFSIIIVLCMLSSVFLGLILSLSANSIKHWRTSNGALIISNSNTASKIPEKVHKGDSIFTDNMGTVLICNKFKCYFTQ